MDERLEDIVPIFSSFGRLIFITAQRKNNIIPCLHILIYILIGKILHELTSCFLFELKGLEISILRKKKNLHIMEMK